MCNSLEDNLSSQRLPHLHLTQVTNPGALLRRLIALCRSSPKINLPQQKKKKTFIDLSYHQRVVPPKYIHQALFLLFWDEEPNDDNNNDGKYRGISNDAGPGHVDRKRQAIELFRCAVWSFRGACYFNMLMIGLFFSLSFAIKMIPAKIFSCGHRYYSGNISIYFPHKKNSIIRI